MRRLTLRRFWKGLMWGIGRGTICVEVDCPYCDGLHEIEIDY